MNNFLLVNLSIKGSKINAFIKLVDEFFDLLAT